MEVISPPTQSAKLRGLTQLEAKLAKRFESLLHRQPALNRQLVSNQANKERPCYRWYKYKEAFSASLVDYFLTNYSMPAGRILDPFAGMGTTLFAASAGGRNADGVELLPIGQEIMRSRMALQSPGEKTLSVLRRWLAERPWKRSSFGVELPILRITKGAYPPNTLREIERFIGAWQTESKELQRVLRFALLCVLESVSYTRKDGQYLRWDHRSGRRQGDRPFNKGPMPSFEAAITGKIDEILDDCQQIAPIELFNDRVQPGEITLMPGSCLDELPTLRKSNYSAIITSPPYCNRYDYTRTYALELALLDVDEPGLAELRQRMLSCTVENRRKNLLGIKPDWANALRAADGQTVLQAVLEFLEGLKEAGELNNPGIPRMVRGYFYEMACVIWECARVLRSGAYLFMVNDNVRYAGASIPVDLILSDIAEQLGFTIEQILVLPNGKGNSSQQMGAHGREPLRKCVYVWRKD